MIIKMSRYVSLIRYIGILALIGLSSFHLFAQSKDTPSIPQQESKEGIIFKFPKNYMPADFPDHKGFLMLKPKTPAVIFIVYPKDGETIEQLRDYVKGMVKRMFIHDEKEQLAWVISTLPTHKSDDVEDPGELMSAAHKDGHLQLAMYTRTYATEQLVYGYFAMKFKKEPQGGDKNPELLDKNGKGVDEFDRFWKTISKPKTKQERSIKEVATPGRSEKILIKS
jgi:hypothetical protein